MTTARFSHTANKSGTLFLLLLLLSAISIQVNLRRWGYFSAGTQTEIVIGTESTVQSRATRDRLYISVFGEDYSNLFLSLGKHESSPICPGPCLIPEAFPNLLKNNSCCLRKFKGLWKYFSFSTINVIKDKSWFILEKFFLLKCQMFSAISISLKYNLFKYC